MADVVIGSGPSGIAAASALVAQGRKVILLDGGGRPSPGDEARREAMASSSPDDWTPADRDGWRAAQYAAPPGQVRRFGSDFAMEPEAATFDGAGGIALRASRAEGGLSNLWGAAVLPYSPHDTRDWPVSPAEMAPHYRAVAALLPIAGQPDDLEALFPSVPMRGRQPLDPSPQAGELMARLGRRRDRLRALGVTVGAARQAVGDGCRACAMCLHGCPWGLIWSARRSIADLAPVVDHRPGQVALALAEDAAGVTVTLAGGETLRCGRVFVAAGVLETARIMLASFPALEVVTLRDSQQAFLPMLTGWRSRPRPDSARLHTLAQIFAEIDDPRISPRLVHAQIYTWNDFYRRDLLQRFGRLPFAPAVLDALSLRLVVAQMFLHSDHSARLVLRLGRDGRLGATVGTNAETGQVTGRALKRLARAFRAAGLIPLTPASRRGTPGSGFHAGASFPIRPGGGPGASDILGRPLGLKRVHLVDASSLPAIPATTITLGVMANAHRIADWTARAEA